MKKLLSLMMVLSMMAVGMVSVSAEEPVEVAVDGAWVSNMDADTYLTSRLAQIDDAFNKGLISEAEKAELIEHVTEIAENGEFGNGPAYANGDGNAACILGENDLGIFRSESAGMRTGLGNGLSAGGQGMMLRDGSGSSQAYDCQVNGEYSQSAQGNRRGKGLR